jgi:Holliday junction resolvase RusA-like endonuclease
VKIEFYHECVIPKTTAQQRRQNKKGGYKGDNLKKATAFWQAVMELYKPEKPFTGAIKLTVTFNFPHLKGKSGVIPKLTRPDTDNLIKLVKDAMTKTGYWNDDSQVYSETIEKYHSEVPGIFVRVENKNL